MAAGIEAVVLRTLRYGEADVIAQLYTRDGGRRGVIAKGARKPRSRLGARLEPFLVVDLQVFEGKGDLSIVRGVDVIAPHEQLRSSWRAQQVGAVALDLVVQLTNEREPGESTYHLLRNFLDLLDSTSGRSGSDAEDDGRRAAALLIAFELKLLHVVGIAPQLGACVRCGAEVALVAYSAPDGGVVCAGCRTAGDQLLDAATHAGAVQLMRVALAELATLSDAELPESRVLRTIGSGIVSATCHAHAGVRPRTP